MRPLAKVQRLLGSLVLPFAFLACGSTQKETRPRIASVDFAGNKEIGDGELEDGLATRGPRGVWRRRTVFDRQALDEDRARIERYYRSRGYFGAAVTDVRVEKAAADKVEVEFQIREGEPVSIAGVRFDGAPADSDVDASALRAVAGINPGDPFVHDTYMAAKERLLEHLVVRGFAHAAVRGEVRVQPSERRAELMFAIDAGPRVRFGSLDVLGLRTIPRSAIEHRLAWKEGDLYHPRDLANTRARLRSLGVFSTVRVALADERLEKTSAQVTVVEAPRNTVRLGGGISIDRIRWGLRGVAGYSLLGAAGPLTTFKADVLPGYVVLRDDSYTDRDSGPEVEARTSLEKDDFVWPLVNALVGVDYAVRQVETYTSQGTTARARLKRSFGDGLVHAAIGYQFQLLDFLDVNDAIDPLVREDLGLRTPYRLGLVETSLAVDGRDDAVRPRLGYYAMLGLQGASGVLGSEFSFATITPEVRGYVPAGDRIVIAGLIRWSQLIAGDTLPITRRYFGGGAIGHRGFAQRRLSPVASREIPDDNGRAVERSVGIGGEAMLLASVEARFDVATIADQNLSVGLFTDVGDVVADALELNPFDLHVAPGIGLRFHTPIGPLRLDLAYRLNRYGDDEPDPRDRFAFHLTLGEAF